MRFWLWLTTGMVTQQWVAIHRKHHRFTEVEGDPHSPHVWGINRVMWKGAFLYRDASKDREMVNSYGAGTPDDWIERNLYSKYTQAGLWMMGLINIALFGWVGLIILAIQIIWIPFWAAGVVNGIGHWWGYRNGNTKDQSRNISPIGVLIGGEELHNNHHLEPANPKFSRKWFEVDIGWIYIQLLSKLGLAKVRST